MTRVAKEPAILDRPVLGWLAASVTADGALEGGAWEGNPGRAWPCDGAGSPHAAIGPAWRCIVEAEHSVPAPFCGCGLIVHPDEPVGRWRDRYRDRLGHRMQTAALVVVWGRVIVERDRVVGQYGSVLALLACADDSDARHRRIAHAARRLDAELVILDDVHERPDFRAIADRIGAPHGERLEPHDAAALLRRRDVRRWQTRRRDGVQGGLMTMHGISLGAGLTAIGLLGIGVPAAVTAPAVGVPAVGLWAHAWRHTLLGVVAVEALAASPTGQQVGEPIALTPPHVRLGRVPDGLIGNTDS